MHPNNIIYKDVVKKFEGKKETVTALKGVSFEIEQGELFCLLGPSGCGKTTLLRISAGLESLTSGQIFYGEKDITSIPPFRRNIGMVFQSFALYPHMSVFENVAYGLRIRKKLEDFIKKKVTEIMELVGLPDVLRRNPSPTALSGGQQQRIAIARALVYDPEILFLDEPLASLDAKLRRYMRAEIRRIQKATNITTIYVTHDQEEAMAIGDRLAIMNTGLVEQIGSSDQVYHQPENMFVANFIGKMNFFPATILEIQGNHYKVELEHNQKIINLSFEMNQIRAKGISKGEKVTLGSRPENLTINTNTGEGPLTGRIQIIQNLGKIVRYEVSLLQDAESKLIEVDMKRKLPDAKEGDEVCINFSKDSTLVFPGKKAI
ncbi:sugar ABC transporter ATP-binding protein [Candidatus Atribacteria bacterium HGW-Atribacteria-1]|nr:MAG: sugar ABC transporter ATP-binding protein [Candidatus Atribacteria bacterium HGW-Atribacteria-1]